MSSTSNCVNALLMLEDEENIKAADVLKCTVEMS
jgi:hypothetical protein